MVRSGLYRALLKEELMMVLKYSIASLILNLNKQEHAGSTEMHKQDNDTLENRKRGDLLGPLPNVSHVSGIFYPFPGSTAALGYQIENRR